MREPDRRGGRIGPTLGRRNDGIYVRMNPKLFACLFALPLILLTSAQQCVAQTVSIFGGVTPNNPIVTGNAATTLDMKFWSSAPGSISGIRFYRGVHSPGGYIAELYSASGSLLGSVVMIHESGPVPGWQAATFAKPISISPNTTYVAAYFAPSGQYSEVSYGLTQGVTAGQLNVPASSIVGGNGVYTIGRAFPTKTNENSNYLVDVSFTSTAPTPYLTLNFNPANPSIASNAPGGTVVATITATWSDGNPFTGTLSFGPPYSNDHATFAISGNNLIVNPSGPGLSSDALTTQDVTIVATQ
jgi:Domain of unknown function (DUF4082)